MNHNIQHFKKLNLNWNIYCSFFNFTIINRAKNALFERIFKIKLKYTIQYLKYYNSITINNLVVSKLINAFILFNLYFY